MIDRERTHAERAGPEAFRRYLERTGQLEDGDGRDEAPLVPLVQFPYDAFNGFHHVTLEGVGVGFLTFSEFVNGRGRTSATAGVLWHDGRLMMRWFEFDVAEADQHSIRDRILDDVTHVLNLGLAGAESVPMWWNWAPPGWPFGGGFDT